MKIIFSLFILLSLLTFSTAASAKCTDPGSFSCPTGHHVEYKMPNLSDMVPKSDKPTYPEREFKVYACPVTVFCVPDSADSAWCTKGECGKKMTPTLKKTMGKLYKNFKALNAASHSAFRNWKGTPWGENGEKQFKKKVDAYKKRKALLGNIQSWFSKVYKKKSKSLKSQVSKNVRELNKAIKLYQVRTKPLGIKDSNAYVKDTLKMHSKKNGGSCSSSLYFTYKLTGNPYGRSFNLNTGKKSWSSVQGKIKRAKGMCGFPKRLDNAISILEERKKMGATDAQYEIDKLLGYKKLFFKMEERALKSMAKLKTDCGERAKDVSDAISELKKWEKRSGDSKDIDMIVGSVKTKVKNDCSSLTKADMSKVLDVIKYAKKKVGSFSRDDDYKYAEGSKFLTALYSAKDTVTFALDEAKQLAKVISSKCDNFVHKVAQAAKNGMAVNKWESKVDSFRSDIFRISGYLEKDLKDQVQTSRKFTRMCKIASTPERIFTKGRMPASAPSGQQQ